MSGDVIMAAVPVLVAALVCWRGWRGVDGGFVSRWQERFAVVVPSEEKQFVVERLVWGRRVRATFVAAGIIVAGLPAYMNLIDPSRSASFANPLVGFAWLFGATVGALIAELFVVQRPRARQASLVPRHSRDYVDHRFVKGVYAISATTTILAVLATALDWWRWHEAWIGVGASVIATASVHFGVRAVVERPAIATDHSVQAVDDALRADGAFRVVGAAVALATAGLTTIHFGNARGLLAALSLLIGLVSYFGLALWWTLARDVKWSVRHARSPL